jgi:hypothetical protein
MYGMARGDSQGGGGLIGPSFMVTLSGRLIVHGWGLVTNLSIEKKIFANTSALTAQKKIDS